MTGQLQTAIEQAQQTQSALIAATGQSGSYDERELIRLRGQFQRDMLAISQASREDTALKSDPAKFAEFNRRQRETQAHLSRHQSNWMLREIERDRSGYLSATKDLRKAQDEFFRWAKDWLSSD